MGLSKKEVCDLLHYWVFLGMFYFCWLTHVSYAIHCKLNSNYINIFPLLSFRSESFGNGNFVVAELMGKKRVERQI